MLYLNTKDILELGVNWDETVNIIKQTAACIEVGEFHQPIKPYLKFPDPVNRIIAMPAYVGSNINISGIKWISSFPRNIDKNIPRAHSITVLSDTTTGQHLATINTALISGIRTASVTGLFIKEVLNKRKIGNINVGIIGYGPIGQLHLQMLANLFDEKIESIHLFDVRNIQPESIPRQVIERTHIVNKWEDAYQDCDLIITCTVSVSGYIDLKPKEGAMLLNVSLRDYKPSILDYKPVVIVDNWEEVCRASTDIEVLNKTRGLCKEDTISISEVVCANALEHITNEKILFFNPMGMASFDISIANYYYYLALQNGFGKDLED